MPFVRVIYRTAAISCPRSSRYGVHRNGDFHVPGRVQPVPGVHPQDRGGASSSLRKPRPRGIVVPLMPALPQLADRKVRAIRRIVWSALPRVFLWNKGESKGESCCHYNHVAMCSPSVRAHRALEPLGNPCDTDDTSSFCEPGA